MIFSFLLQAIPEGDALDSTLMACQQGMQTLQASAAATVQGGSFRTPSHQLKVESYRNYFIQAFAPLIAEPAKQIWPEWDFLSPKLPPDHLHEAFRRILLQWIVRLTTSLKPCPVHPAKRKLQDPLPNHSHTIRESITVRQKLD